MIRFAAFLLIGASVAGAAFAVFLTVVLLGTTTGPEALSLSRSERLLVASTSLGSLVAGVLAVRWYGRLLEGRSTAGRLSAALGAAWALLLVWGQHAYDS